MSKLLIPSNEWPIDIILTKKFTNVEEKVIVDESDEFKLHMPNQKVNLNSSEKLDDAEINSDRIREESIQEFERSVQVKKT